MKRMTFRIRRILMILILICLGNHPGFAEPEKNKLDPTLNELFYFRSFKEPESVSKTVFQNDSIRVFIRCSRQGVLKENRIPFCSISDNVCTARLSLSQIEALTHLPEVEGLEASTLCKTESDVSIPEIRADAVWRWFGSSGYKGKGVIVGIVDSGIDWSHPDFIAANGTSRILYLWDQTDERGPNPTGYSNGTLYTREQINAELDGTPAGVVKEKDINGHGTHVAGIAAGNGRGTGNGKPSEVYRGVAPEADLIIVKSGDFSHESTKIADGAKFVFDMAKGKPAVVNISLGRQYGPHDGTSDFELGLDGLLGDKGRAIVVCAGNDGDDPIHFKKVFESVIVENTAKIAFKINKNQSNTADHVYFDIWYSVSTNLSVSVVTPAGLSYGPVASGNSIKTFDAGEGQIVINNAAGGTDKDNGDREMVIRVSDAGSNGKVTDNLAVGTWQLSFSGKAGRFDGWIYDSTVDAGVTGELDYSTLVIEPGNTRRAVTVAGYVSRSSWPSVWADPIQIGGLTVGALSDFSSPGPTRAYALDANPRQKPEVSAPGEYVLSSMSDQISTAPFDQYVATDKKHMALRGTSMAAPHVTGLIALMFQANPNATVSDIRGKLFESVRHDAFTGSGWNKSFGYGKVDAVEAIKKLTSVGSEPSEHPVDFSLMQNYPNPFNGSTTIEFEIPPSARNRMPVVLDILDIRGRTVRSFSFPQGAENPVRIVWDGREETGRAASSGIYTYRLSMGTDTVSRKLVFIR